jgi:hypothetical protein
MLKQKSVRAGDFMRFHIRLFKDEMIEFEKELFS